MTLSTGEVVYIRPQPRPGEKHERYNWDAPILVSPHRATTIYHGSYRLWKSENRGDSWQVLSGALTRDEERITLPIMGRQQRWDNAWDFYAMRTYNTITSISESPVKEGLLYVGTDDGLLQISGNGGESWREIPVEKLPGAPERAYVNDIKADRFDANTVYVALDAHKQGDFRPLLYRSRNRGKSWENIGTELPEKHLVWRIVQDPQRAEMLYLGTEFGVFFSPNGGENWIKLKGGMPTIAVRDLAIQERDDDLVAATFGRGFYLFDDLKALRAIDQETLKAEAALLPLRDAWWYIPRPDLSFGPGKGSQGEAHFIAPNPPYGAQFRYHLLRGFASAEAKRKKREKSLESKGEDSPFAGWDALADEMQDPGAKLWLEVRNSKGKVLRRIKAPTQAGFHEVVWDMRSTSAGPIDSKQENISEGSYLVAPGLYSAQLMREENGAVRPFGQSPGLPIKALAGRKFDQSSGRPKADLLGRCGPIGSSIPLAEESVGRNKQTTQKPLFGLSAMKPAKRQPPERTGSLTCGTENCPAEMGGQPRQEYHRRKKRSEPRRSPQYPAHDEPPKHLWAQCQRPTSSRRFAPGSHGHGGPAQGMEQPPGKALPGPARGRCA